MSRKWFARVRDFKEPREKSVEHNGDDDDGNDDEDDDMRNSFVL